MVFRSFPSPAAALTLLLLVVFVIVNANDESSSTGNTNSEYRNVYGDALQPCSSDGMALTGYTRSGYCTDQNDDTGSHHICIDLSSLGGGSDGSSDNFCSVTGQPDWCDYTDMACHSDPSDEACPVVDWCVCQWAFASYIQAAGGCDNIQTIVCEAVNRQAIVAYQRQVAAGSSADRGKFADALNCLVDRCGLDSSLRIAAGSGGAAASASSSVLSGYHNLTNGNASPGALLAVAVAVLAAVMASVRYHRKTSSSKTIHLNGEEEEDDAAKDVPKTSASRLL